MRKWLGIAASLMFIAVLFYLPLATILVRGFATETLSYLAEAKTWSVVWFTVWQALVSTGIALVLGLLFAYLLYRKSFRGVGLARALFAVPFVLPVLVVAIAFSALRTQNDQPTAIALIIAAHVFINTAITTRAVGTAWMNLDAEYENAAAIDGAGRFASFWHVTLPMLRGSVLASATLTFAYCVSSFGVILVLGSGLINSIETSIFVQVFTYLDLPKATALAIVQLVITLVVFALLEKPTASQLELATTEVKSGQKLDKRDLPVIVIGLVAAAGFAWPLVTVFVRAIELIDKVVLPDATATINSLRNVVLVVLACALIAVFVARLIYQNPRNLFGKVLSFSYLAPVAISTVLLGLGYLLAFNSPPFALRTSWLVVPIAETLLALPIVVRIVLAAFSSLDSEVLEAARLDGANESKQFWLIELPLIRPSIQVALGFAAIIALGDFGASSFLAYGDQETLPVQIFRLYGHPGESNYATALFLCLWLIVVSALVVWLTSLAPRHRRTAR